MRTAFLRVLAGGVLVVGAAAAFVAHQADRRWHFVEVQPSMFFRSALLPPDVLAERLEEHGIRTVVTLRSVRDREDGDWYERQRALLREKGVLMVDIPLVAETPPSPAQVAEFLRVLDDARNLPVMVHCEKGSVRAAGMEALYRREYLHEDAETALDEAGRFGRDLEEDAPRIAAFIRSYEPRKDGARAKRP